MKIHLRQHGAPEHHEPFVVDPGPGTDVTLTEVFNGVRLVTEDGEMLGICMRDSGFEVHYYGEGFDAGWHTFNAGSAPGLPRLDPATPYEAQRVAVFKAAWEAADRAGRTERVRHALSALADFDARDPALADNRPAPGFSPYALSDAVRGLIAEPWETFSAERVEMNGPQSPVTPDEVRAYVDPAAWGIAEEIAEAAANLPKDAGWRYVVDGHNGVRLVLDVLAPEEALPEEQVSRFGSIVAADILRGEERDGVAEWCVLHPGTRAEVSEPSRFPNLTAATHRAMRFAFER